MTRESDEFVPARLGDFELKESLGDGGGGMVFRSEQPGLGSVAIKVLRPKYAKDHQIRVRFIEEARALRELRLREAVVTVYAVHVHFGEDIDLPFIVMEFCPSGSLGKKIKDTLRRKCTDEEVDGLIVLLAKILGALHNLGLVHRDVKPENILVRDTNEPRDTPVGELLRTNEQLVLADFGLLHPIGPVAPEESGVGTPAWGAPELFVEGFDLTPAADVFSASAVAVFARTGVKPSPIGPDDPNGVPFSDKVLAEMGFREAALRRGLSVKPEDRQQNMQEWHESLIRPAAKPPKRRWPLVGSLAVVLVSIVGLASLLLPRFSDSTTAGTEPDQAAEEAAVADNETATPNEADDGPSDVPDGPTADGEQAVVPPDDDDAGQAVRPPAMVPVAILGDPCATTAAHGDLVSIETAEGPRQWRVMRAWDGVERNQYISDDWLILGTSGDDEIQGNTGDDVLCGLGGDDSLLGNQGDDHLYGGEGHNQLRGQDGNDWLHSDGNDQLWGGHGAGGESGTPEAVNYCEPEPDTGFDPASVCQTPPDNDPGDDGSADVEGVFTVAEFGAAIEDAQAACDAAVGRNGQKYQHDGVEYIVVELSKIEPNLTSGTGLDKYTGFPESDKDNIIIGTDEGEAVGGFGGNDIICGLGGDDAIAGNDGNDILIGGTGSDNFTGNDGDDLISADQADLVFIPGGIALRGGTGNDYCWEYHIEHVRDCEQPDNP